MLIIGWRRIVNTLLAQFHKRLHLFLERFLVIFVPAGAMKINLKAQLMDWGNRYMSIASLFIPWTTLASELLNIQLTYFKICQM